MPRAKNATQSRPLSIEMDVAVLNSLESMRRKVGASSISALVREALVSYDHRKLPVEPIQKRTTISVRVSDELREEIAKIAASKNQFVGTFLENAVVEYVKKGKSKAFSKPAKSAAKAKAKSGKR